MDTAYENRRIALIIFGIILALTALNFAAVRPPAAVGVDAPETDFASGRALRHLEQIAAWINNCVGVELKSWSQGQPGSE